MKILEKKSIDKSNKKGKLPFTIFVLTDEYTTNRGNGEIITNYMQIFASIIEERIQNKLRRNIKPCKNQMNKKE